MDDMNNNNFDNNGSSNNNTDNNGYDQYNSGNQYNNGNPFNNGNQYNNGNPFNNGNQYNNGNPFNNGNQYNNGNPYNNGYNGNNPFNGNYNNGYPANNMYFSEENVPVQKSAGPAIAALVISLVNLVLCCTVLSFITVPLCLILAIVTLAGKRKGKGMAIASIIISVISGIFFVYYGYIVYKVTPDFMYYVDHQNQIIEEFERDGTIPERFEKYRDPKYDKYWNRIGYDTFDEFFADFIKSQKENRYNYENSSNRYNNKNDTNIARYIDNYLLTAV